MTTTDTLDPPQPATARKVGAVVAVLGAVAAFVGVLPVIGVSVVKAPVPVADQLAELKHELARQGRRASTPAGDKPLDLHGTNGKSYVLLVQDGTGAAMHRSDELRVYDLVDDHLVEKFRFEPQGRHAVFQYRATTDVDSDGASELVGGYGQADHARAALVPFALDYDDVAGHYRLVPLDLGAPVLSSLRLDKRFQTPERQYGVVYRREVTFSDPVSDPRGVLRLTGRPVQDFIITQRPLRLVASYFLQPPRDQAVDVAVLELKGGDFDGLKGVPMVRRCTLSAPEVIRLKLLDKSLQRTMDARWKQVMASDDCTATYNP
jgi:hypothetical protein